jgi:hypothetical protein
MATAGAEAEATAQLDELRKRRARAAARVSGLEQEWRTTVAAARNASAALAEAERIGASASKFHTLESRLADAKARAAQPFAERIEGAKAAVRDTDQAIRAHIGGNLVELVEAKEADGARVAERINELAGALIEAWLERERIASDISALATKVAPISPGDVSWSRAEDAFRACTALLNADGEEGPTLSRVRDPWARILGAVPEAVPEPDRDASVSATVIA